MSLSLTLLAMSLVISFGVLLLNLVSAPEGYEDECGFHANDSGQPTAVPVKANVTPRRVAV